MGEKYSTMDLDIDGVKALLQKEVVHVRFLKKSTGEEREMWCTLNINEVPETDAEKMRGISGGTKKPDDLITVWDTKSHGWRSFYYGNILEIESAGGRIVAQNN